MKREENEIMEQLSMDLYGKKYQWRKLRTKGVPTMLGGAPARIRLTVEQAKEFMLQKIKLKKEAENANRETSNGEGVTGQVAGSSDNSPE